MLEFASRERIQAEITRLDALCYRAGIVWHVWLWCWCTRRQWLEGVHDF
jgi:hypothetical protein